MQPIKRALKAIQTAQKSSTKFRFGRKYENLAFICSLICLFCSQKAENLKHCPRPTAGCKFMLPSNYEMLFSISLLGSRSEKSFLMKVCRRIGTTPACDEPFIDVSGEHRTPEKDFPCYATLNQNVTIDDFRFYAKFLFRGNFFPLNCEARLKVAATRRLIDFTGFVRISPEADDDGQRPNDFRVTIDIRVIFTIRRI